MSDVTSQVIDNTKDLRRNFNGRGTSVVNINGQEFYSRTAGEHNFWLTLDNDMEFVSAMKFKLVIGTGRFSGGGGVDTGENLFPELQAWLDKYPVGSVVDTDGFYGAQCWDYANAFWKQQVGRTLVTKPGGNGKACQCWTISLDANSVGFTIIRNWSSLRPGDWVFWDCDSTRPDGHVAMCVSSMDSNGQYSFYGQNQGGTPVAAGGAAVSVAKFSVSGFLGGLRYKGWEQPNIM